VVVLIAAVAFVVLRSSARPEDTAAGYAAAWQRGDTSRMRAMLAGAPADFETQHTRMRSDLGITKTVLRLGEARTEDGTATVPFTARHTLKNVGDWSYNGKLTLVEREDTWRVNWSPAVLHPALKQGQRFRLSTRWPKRGTVLAANGTRLDGPAASGSIQQLVGVVGQATADDLKRLGAPYKAGDVVGKGGIQQSLQSRLAGRPTATVQIADTASKRVLASVGQLPGKPGANVKTSLDMATQTAAARAIISQGNPASLVAIRPSTGEILAVVNQPGGFNRGLVGRYPPGSTFKVITAAALLGSGLQPGNTVGCPKTANVGGLSIKNFEDEAFGSIPFRTAFAKSCNTAFATQVEKRLNPQRLSKAARDFGFGEPLSLGVQAQRGGFPNPRDGAELAAASFGQGRVTASPLTMAGVAGAVRDGSWRPPYLVTDPKTTGRAKTHRLDPKVVGTLRTLMGAVVTEGTAAGRGLPAGTIGKTGTAEYGSANPPDTHAWFIGSRGDLAFAVIVEGGKAGGEVAAPVGAAFLRGL
jgi:cell division protein FtsI/penicillin-binding protein 2